MHSTEIKYQLGIAINSCASLDLTQIVVTKRLLVATLDLIQKQEDEIEKLTRELDDYLD